MIQTDRSGDDIIISVHLDKPLPEHLEGKDGFNLEFLPSAYFDKIFMMDGIPGIIPHYPSGPTRKNEMRETEPEALANGHKMVLYIPMQMDPVLVNEAYRLWHGASHLDDALQASVNHEHFSISQNRPG